MKKFFYAFALFTSVMQAQVGIGTSTPNGALDVNSSLPLPSTHKAGLLPPIVALTATNSFATTTVGSNVINPNGGGNPLTGTIVYNTYTSTAGANQVTPGYYFYNGTVWEKITSGSTTNWSLTGNAGTTAGTNYVGTTDAVDLVLKTANTERLRINNAVGSTTGTAGDISIGDANSGTIKSNRELVLRQDGDTFGSSALRLRNRSGENGAIFENLNPLSGANLVDFLFKTGTTASPISSNIRFETRSGSRKVTGNTTEWQFGQPDTTNGGPTLVVGANGTGSKSAFLIGNVGITTNDPKTSLDVNGALSLREGAASVIANGINNNVSLGTTPSSFYRITLPTAAFSLTGLIPVTGANGQIVTLENLTTQNFTISHEDASSTAANRIYCPGATNLILYGINSSITLSYNSTLQRWVVIGNVSNTNAKPGTIINTVMLPPTTTGDISINATAYTTFLTYSYTPVSASSTIIVEFNTKYDINGYGDDSFSSQILVTGTEVAYNTQKFTGNGGGGSRSGTLFPLMGSYTNTTTGAKTININVKRDASDDNILLKRDISTWLKITEIAR